MINSQDMMIMKALNPSGEGYIEVTFPDNKNNDYTLWNIVCDMCNNSVGGCFSGPNLPGPKISKYAICPYCGSGDNLKLVQVLD